MGDTPALSDNDLLLLKSEFESLGLKVSIGG